jgi:hypothetical protein
MNEDPDFFTLAKDSFVLIFRMGGFSPGLPSSGYRGHFDGAGFGYD